MPMAVTLAAGAALVFGVEAPVDDPGTIVIGGSAITGAIYLLVRTLRQDSSYDRLVKGQREQLESERQDHNADRDRWAADRERMDQIVANKDATIARLTDRLQEVSAQSSTLRTRLSVAEGQVSVLRMRLEERGDEVTWPEPGDVPPPPGGDGS